MDHLELALIELEYARADFAYRKATAEERSELAALETILLKLAVAGLALQIAIGALASRPDVPEVERESSGC